MKSAGNLSLMISRIRLWNEWDRDHMLNEEYEKFDVLKMKMVIDYKNKNKNKFFFFLWG